MLAEQIVAGIASSAIVTERELENAVRLRRQKRVVETLKLPVARFSDVVIGDADIRAHYESNQADYVAPEQVKLKYIELSRDVIAAAVEVEDDELRAVYERRKADFQMPEQRDASHILLILEDDADEATVAAVRERLEAIKAQIGSGSSFEELALEHSEDPGSARQGGSLGAISRGVMDPAFEDAAFKLALNEVSDPVRSAFGLHLIKVDAIQASKSPTFEEVRDKMRAKYQDEKAEQAFVEQVETMVTVAFEDPESLQSVADALGLTPSVSDWVSPQVASNSGIGRNRAVIAAAFNPDVLRDGFNSEPIELDPSRVIVLRIAEHRPSRQQPLDEVQENIRRTLAVREARRLAADGGRTLLERLQSGEDKRDVAAQAELEWSGELELARDSRNVAASVLSAAFRMTRPASARAVFDGIAGASGDFVIVGLSRVIDGVLADEDKEQREAVTRNLEVEAGRATYNAVVQALRNSADVVIIRENL
jgi:peptidyl-prolyl cis-trans isomerase D